MTETEYLAMGYIHQSLVEGYEMDWSPRGPGVNVLNPRPTEIRVTLDDYNGDFSDYIFNVSVLEFFKELLHALPSELFGDTPYHRSLPDEEFVDVAFADLVWLHFLSDDQSWGKGWKLLRSKHTRPVAVGTQRVRDFASDYLNSSTGCAGDFFDALCAGGYDTDEVYRHGADSEWLKAHCRGILLSELGATAQSSTNTNINTNTYLIT